MTRIDGLCMVPVMMTVLLTSTDKCLSGLARPSTPRVLLANRRLLMSERGLQP
jgi:hypothetical protein